MSEEIATAAADLATVARLRAELAGLREAYDQQGRALEAERAARSRYELIVLAARRLIAGPDSQAYTALAAQIDAYDQHPAATPLLDVLSAARSWREAVETMDGQWIAEQVLIAALKAIDGGR